jgi:hypothetical protein
MIPIQVAKNIEDLEGVNVENGKLHIERLEKNTPEGARDFSISLYDLIPRIKLTDLLMEVARWTSFQEQFIHASTNRTPNDEETKVLMATIMAMGTNIGLTKMAEATPDISYRQMANTAQWRLHEDAMNKAQAVLVNYHHNCHFPHIGEMAPRHHQMGCVYRSVWLRFMLMLTRI